MAGIGFELQKLYEGKKGFSKIKAYFFATLISSGPWIFSIICLVAIGLLSGAFFQDAALERFSALIVYCFAGSLILTGPIQFVLTRYLADKIFLKQMDRLLPALLSMLFVTVCLTLPVGTFFAIQFKLELVRAVFGVFFFMVISCIWVMMDFLSCLKNYKAITNGFLLGVLITLVMVVADVLWLRWPLIIFYALGQFTIFLLLMRSIFKEFRYSIFFIREVFQYYRQFPSIMVIGLFYSGGIWIDKIIYWITRGAPVDKLHGTFYAYPVYDISFYIAYLTIIPTLAHFIIRIETDFYLKYRAFYDSIVKKPLAEIEENKRKMSSSFSRSFVELFVIQMIISGLVYVFAAEILTFFGAPLSFLPAFRNLAFAACFHVMFLFTVIFMMYFDLRRTTTWIVSIFFVLNVVLTYQTSRMDDRFIGFGYMAALVIPMIIGVTIMIFRLRNLEYIIFRNQPV